MKRRCENDFILQRWPQRCELCVSRLLDKILRTYT